MNNYKNKLTKEIMMNKESKTKQQPIKKLIQTRFVQALFYGTALVGVGILLPEIGLASSKFDVDAGVTAATAPLVGALKAHWGKGVLLTGGASALIGEGDPRQRAIRAAIGCGASGGVVLALIAMLS